MNQPRPTASERSLSRSLAFTALAFYTLLAVMIAIRELQTVEHMTQALAMGLALAAISTGYCAKRLFHGEKAFRVTLFALVFLHLILARSAAGLLGGVAGRVQAFLLLASVLILVAVRRADHAAGHEDPDGEDP